MYSKIVNSKRSKRHKIVDIDGTNLLLYLNIKNAIEEN